MAEHSQLLVDFNGGSVRIQQTVSDVPGDITTRLGEAVGLCIIDKLHDLTLPDWTPIPELREKEKAKKTLDFITNTASSSTQFIQIETKGAHVPDNNKKTGSVPHHKKSILGKKLAQRPLGVSNTLYYGAIGSFDKDTTRNAKCWLLDPPGEFIDRSPVDYRVLARMTFIENWIRLIAPQSALSRDLYARLQKLNTSNDIFQYNKQHLKPKKQKTTKIHFFPATLLLKEKTPAGFRFGLVTGN